MSKILLVEDDDVLCEAMNAKLVTSGHQVVIARDGFEALSAMKTNSFDLVLLDIVMPRLDGFEVLKQIRQDRNQSQVPIVITSNLGQDKEIHQGLNLGANDYLIKANLDISELIAKANLYLKE